MYIYGKMQRKSPYKTASVLLLRWEEDKSAEDELLALEKVFRERYNYHTDKWAIPTVPNPSIKLSVQMASFIEHARSDHLLIIYYAGHSYVGADKQVYWARCAPSVPSSPSSLSLSRSILAPYIIRANRLCSNAREDACRLKWGGVRCLFEDAQPDILLLLDTCAVHDSPVAGSHGTKQAIAAYSPGQRASEYHTRSFTAYLAESLYNLSSGRSFTVQRLYEDIMRQRQHDIAAKHVNGSGQKVHPPERTPTIFTLTPGKTQSITLSPLRQGTSAVQERRSSADSNGYNSHQDVPFGSSPVPDLTFDEARVLVCTTFVGEASPDMVFYNQWLQNTPTLAAKITMEGMFLGPPTMLLVSMPLSVWNVVQHDKVCCFLGYINSHNMIDLYKSLVKSTPASPSPPATQKAVEDGRILLEASKVAATSPTSKRRHELITPRKSSSYPKHSRPEIGTPARNPLPNSAPLTTSTVIVVPPVRDEGEDSAEMKEAAEQLKALSHVRHISDGGVSVGGASDTRQDDSPSSNGANESAIEEKIKPVLPPARKPLAKSQPKYDTRCTLCGHPPFKDASSLRKHIAAAHTRPFPCAFSFAGCSSTFGSKNEWKRHIASQHLCLQYYRCSQCPSSAAEGKGNEFNRKDLFTQHLRRMHAPFAIKKALTKGDSKLQTDWENHVREMQVSCLVTRREPPQHVACPKTDCLKEFEGHIAWDEWTEHVGRHMEKGDGLRIGVDRLLAKWALDEGIIELAEDGEYRFASPEDANGAGMRRDSIINSSFVSDRGKVTDKANDKAKDKAEEKIEMEVDETPTDENKSDDNAIEGNDPDSIVVATSTAMHDRMDTDD